MFCRRLVEIPPFEKFYWVMAVVVPFTPIMLEARGFYTNISTRPLPAPCASCWSTVVVDGHDHRRFRLVFMSGRCPAARW